MQTVKAIYKEGIIHLLSPLQGVKEAELLIIVLDKNQRDSQTSKLFRTEYSVSEQEFQTAGLSSFFDTEDDHNVDWEEVFDVKSR